jgi:hypothetical protein
VFGAKETGAQRALGDHFCQRLTHRGAIMFPNPVNYAVLRAVYAGSNASYCGN